MKRSPSDTPELWYLLRLMRANQMDACRAQMIRDGLFAKRILCEHKPTLVALNLHCGTDARHALDDLDGSRDLFKPKLLWAANATQWWLRNPSTQPAVPYDSMPCHLSQLSKHELDRRIRDRGKPLIADGAAFRRSIAFASDKGSSNGSSSGSGGCKRWAPVPPSISSSDDYVLSYPESQSSSLTVAPSGPSPLFLRMAPSMLQWDSVLFEDEADYSGSFQKAREESAIDRLLHHHGQRIWSKARLVCVGQASPRSPLSKLNPDLARRVFNAC
eukprot:CAMPEP_0119307634 /NCGR_PEP_ID=MMETSP1333-20130426/8078_1 /TAXON_ID=418940 /ORGANISM="Scyphosphaera apsteinii, Strain RCC1455" /LENGTH=272 /DNA_ID=CAMNT_0007311223 /DNA_START=23 /DNA_END=838 /DNA_ORIENTATION=+